MYATPERSSARVILCKTSGKLIARRRAAAQEGRLAEVAEVREIQFAKFRLAPMSLRSRADSRLLHFAVCGAPGPVGMTTAGYFRPNQSGASFQQESHKNQSQRPRTGSVRSTRAR